LLLSSTIDGVLIRQEFDIDLVPGLFLIERKFGEVITPEEARQLLQQFGNIELCYTASHVERTALNLNEGVIVQFELYDDGQNAYSVSFYQFKLVQY
jgi:hypothetical protein